MVLHLRSAPMLSGEEAALGGVDDLFGWGTDLLQELVRIPSVTGGETKVQRAVREVMEGLDLEVDEWCPQLDEVSCLPAFSDDGLPLGERPVLVGRMRSNAPRPQTLVLNGHIDVVPTGDLSQWTVSPWAGEIRDDRLYGRGACDMKGGLVAALLAMAALRSTGLEPAVEVLFQSVIGEESGGVGTLSAVARGHVGDAAIVLEPTNGALCHVGAGSATFRLTVRGVAAHGAMREEGVSAVDLFYEVLDALRQLERARNSSFRHPAYVDGTLVAPISVGRVVAGDWPSTVPDCLVAEGRLGVLPGESLQDARAQFERCISRTTRQAGWRGPEPTRVEWFEGQFEPAETSMHAGLLSVVSDAHEEVVGSAPARRGVPYGSDLRFFTNQATIPAVLYGPGDVALAHTVDESVPLAEVRAVAKVLALVLLRTPQQGYGVRA